MKFSQTLTSSVIRNYPLPDPTEAHDKNSRGRVLAVAGSVSVPGAAVLCGVASLRAGAGKVQLAVPRSIGSVVGTAFLEAGIIQVDETKEGEPWPRLNPRLSEGIMAADAILIGPGLMDSAGASILCREVLATRKDGAIVLDAMALPELRASIVKDYRGQIVITPHHGEMAALLGVKRDAISHDPLRYALAASLEFNCTVVLKSAITHIACPLGQTWLHDGGSIGLATAGSGDVLAGILAGLLARGANPITASLWAVMVHGIAGRILSEECAEVGFLASELLEAIPRAMKQVAT